MQIESQILGIINNKLKNPIYQTIQLLNMKSILKESNFHKKDGVGVHMVILHFVYMLVMNKKMSTIGYSAIVVITGESYSHCLH